MKHVLNNYFDNIFVIAHPDSARYHDFKIRWVGLEHTLCRFVHQNLECKNKNQKAWHIFPNFPNMMDIKDPLSDGQVACALAHMLIYDHIIENKLLNCLILEDDSVFINESNLELALTSDYDILALFTADCDLLINPAQAAPFTKHYTRAGTSAYVLRTYEVAQELMKSQLRCLDTADGVIMRSLLNIYAVYPPVCMCDNSPSIIVNGLY